MTHSHVFHPNDKPLNIRLLWWAALTLPIVIPSVKLDFTTQYLVPEAILSVLLVLVFVLPSKVPESITVSIDNHTLTYCYYNCWGRKRTINIDLNQALAKYQPNSLGRIIKHGKLLLYRNNSYWRQLAINEDAKGGYSKEQLDEILHCIEECGADCHLCMNLKASA